MRLIIGSYPFHHDVGIQVPAISKSGGNMSSMVRIGRAGRLSGSRRRGPTARVGVLVGLTGLLGVGGLQLSASASGRNATPEKALKPDISYFAGKTITFINGSSPGSGGDSLARPLAPYIGQYLHATVNVENITGSGSIAAQDTVAAAAPNGLTIGELTAVSNYEGYIGASAAVNFQQAKMTILGGTYVSPGSCIFASSRAPDQTIYTFLRDHSVHQIGDIVPGAVDMTARSILWAYRVPTALVTGYTSEGGLGQGFARGDEPYAISAETAFLNDLKSGIAKCLIVMGVTKVPSYLQDYPYLKNVPNLVQLVKKNPPPTKQGKAVIAELEAVVRTPSYDFFAPKGMPPAIALALQDAVKFAEQQPQVKAEYVARGNVPGYTPPKTVLEDLNAVAKHIRLLKKPVTSVG